MEATMKLNAVWETKTQLIRYKLEVVRSRDRRREADPEILKDFTRIDEHLRRTGSRKAWPFVGSDAPVFHPGRVLVSEEVMVRLGKEEVLSYINNFVRGGWKEGP